MKRLILLAAIALPQLCSAQYVSEVWSPDNGDGTYTNPVINADYSDPDVCVGASGEDYYMTASSFQCTPGLPILHSKDLVNWQIINYALGNLYEGDEALQQHFSTPRHGAGVWAPSIRYHDGWYYIYWGDPDFGVYMVKTQDPAGKWEPPVCVIKGQGYIDTTPLWDDDGRCYLVNGWANSRSKFASVLTVREMSRSSISATAGTGSCVLPVVCPRVSSSPCAPSRHTVLMSIRLCWHRARLPSTVRIREAGYTRNTAKIGSCTSRTRRLTDAWSI